MDGTSSVPVWAFMALLGVIQALGGMMVMRLWKSVDENTAAVNKMAVDLPTTYATRKDVEGHHEDDRRGFDGIRQHLTELREKVWRLDTRVAVMDGGIKDAQGDLRDSGR